MFEESNMNCSLCGRWIDDETPDEERELHRDGDCLTVFGASSKYLEVVSQ